MNARGSKARLPWVVLVAVGLLFCPSPGRTQEEVIKIGMTNSFSGPLARSATKVWQGVMVWQDWFNAQGGVLVKDKGKRMKAQVIYHDDESNRDNLIRLYEKLATGDGVHFFFGPFGSGQTFVAAPIADKHKKLMITTTGGSPSIYTQGYKLIIQGISQVD